MQIIGSDDFTSWVFSQRGDGNQPTKCDTIGISGFCPRIKPISLQRQGNVRIEPIGYTIHFRTSQLFISKCNFKIIREIV
jgi:hypothetical protein